MCTLVINFRPAHKWPMILAANRDELVNRPSDAPGRYWAESTILAGRDQKALGTWLGWNGALLVAMLNRKGSLGTEPGKTSRGLLAIDLLSLKRMTEIVAFLKDMNPTQYRDFNAFITDGKTAIWARAATGSLSSIDINPGVSILCEGEINDLSHPKIARYLPWLRKVEYSDDPKGDWQSWRDLLMDRAPEGRARNDYMFLAPGASGYATVSSSVIALSDQSRIQWLYRDKEWKKIA